MNILLPLCAYFMADPETFVSLTTFVLVDGGREVPNTTKSGASSACQRTAICLQTDTGPTLNAVLVALWISRGSRPVLLWNPVALWFS